MFDMGLEAVAKVARTIRTSAGFDLSTKENKPFAVQ